MIVDDDENIRHCLHRMISKHRPDCEIRSTADALEAVAMVGANSERTALVITDLMMPTVDGNQLADMIRSISAGIPVICATASTELCSPNLFAAVVAKPFSMNEVLQAVERSIEGEE